MRTTGDGVKGKIMLHTDYKTVSYNTDIIIVKIGIIVKK